MKRNKILVVEDEGIVALDIKGRLESMGHEVIATVDNGQDAIDTVESNPPNLILMDIQIKGEFDGIETAKKLGEIVNIPIIFLTANADEATLQRAKKSGPIAYLLKPFDERELHSTIEIGLYRHELEKTIKSHEERWSKTLMSIGDGVITTDNKGIINFINPEAEKISGYALDEAIYKPVQNILNFQNEDTGIVLQNPILAALHENRTVILQKNTELVKKNGKLIAVEDSAAPIHDKLGNVTGAVLVFRDITEKRKQERELEDYRDNLEAIIELRTADLLEQNKVLECEIKRREKAEQRESELLNQLDRS